MSVFGGHGFGAANGAAGTGAMRSLRGGEKKPPPLMDESRKRERGRILRLFAPYRWRLVSVLLLVVIGAGLAMLPPFLLRDVLDKGIFEHDTTLLSELVLGDDRDRDRDLGAERRADLHLERRRPARHARPARRRLPPPPAAVARVLHAHARGRGAVADRQRHRRHRQRRHADGDDDRPERHDGDRDDRRDVPAGLAARADLVRASCRCSSG